MPKRFLFKERKSKVDTLFKARTQKHIPVEKLDVVESVALNIAGYHATFLRFYSILLAINVYINRKFATRSCLAK